MYAAFKATNNKQVYKILKKKLTKSAKQVLEKLHAHCIVKNVESKKFQDHESRVYKLKD